MSAVQKRKVTNIHSSNHAYQNLHVQEPSKRKRGLVRRLAVFGCVAGMLTYLIISTMITQAKKIDSKQLEKEKVTSQLVEMQKTEQLLKDEIIKLHDDEYLAKLARRDFFLSDDNEIIFNIPQKKDD